MGVEGTLSTAATMMTSSGPTELLRKSVVSVEDCDFFVDELKSSRNASNEDTQTEQENESDECRRRTSIPPTFAYGAEMQLGRGLVEERRWRSFDCSGSTTSRSSTKTASIESLTTRIQQESEKVQKRKAKLGRRFEWIRSMKTMFSSTKKEQVQLLQMQMVAEVAKGNRSLAILNDMKTLVMTMEDEDIDELEHVSRDSRSSAVSTVDANNQRLLDGIENADKVLAEDNLHHILESQTRWLQQLICMHADKKNDVPKKHGVAPSVAMQQFLNDFVRPDGMQRIPCAFDMPTIALVRFEKLINRYKFMKPCLKKALDQVCQDTMGSFVRGGNQASHGKANVFEDREVRDVMQSLIREIVDAIAEEAWVAEKHRCILRAFVEQMVFSRLACACYRSSSTELDELNATWRDQVGKASSLGLHQVGLPFDVPSSETGLAMVNGELCGVLGGGADDKSALFAKSVNAFNRIPHLVPSCVLAAFLNAVRVLYRETAEVLSVSPGCMSADVLLPLMVYVLSRSDLPHLHSQVFLMEEYAIEESQEGSEAAYYLACLQAAMGYIMTKDKVCAE